MRITNIDTLSAYLDRLVTERIKYFFFKKDDKFEDIEHQEIVISEIKDRISCLMEECLKDNNYIYTEEKRTFANNILESIDELTTNDINIGESDRQRLKIAMMEEKRLRKSNEGRSKNKNDIDDNFKKLVGKE
tara:strand:+ start:1920 stop:2318 length:399 start_codon:yes stop_codon:yes gene_type:complete